LRQVRESDAGFILALRLDPRRSRFIARTANDIGRQREFIRRCLGGDEKIYFIIEDRAGRPVGTIRIAEVLADAFEVGSFVVHPDAGVFAAMEAFFLVARYGFEVLGKLAVRGLVVKENRTVCQFFAKVGCVVIGEGEGKVLFEAKREAFYASARRFLPVLGSDWGRVVDLWGGDGLSAGMALRPIQSARAPKAVGPYSQGVVAGELVFLSGQIPIDPASGKLVDGDVAAQVRRVFENMAAVLGEAGLGFADVIKATVFLTDMGDFAAMNAVYGEYFADWKPARSTIGVAALPLGARVEIEVVARRG
jgi:2-iminobutanoate/2-iminopropanoate deaminase